MIGSRAVRNGVPLEKFRFDPKLREKAREDLKLKPNQIALLFVGSGWERKGLLFATEAMAGIPADGAAGSNFESLSKLNCTLDPAQLKAKVGGGAECSYEAAN